MTDYEDELNIAGTLRETDAKCPCCAATIKFDPASGVLKCPYCGYTREITAKGGEESAVAQEQSFAEAENKEADFSWGDGKKTVICKNCGGESVYDQLAVSDVCPYCGSNQVMEAQTTGSLAPNGICPFTVPKEKAAERFKTWIKKKIFAPSALKKSAESGSLLGLFLPFWTFDADTMTNYSAEYGIDRTVTEGEGENKRERTVTDWHSVRGLYQDAFDDFLVIASTRHDNGLLAKIGPFDTNNAKPYDPEYLSGFVSERYSVSLQKGWDNGREGIKRQINARLESKILKDYHADHVRNLKTETVFDNITYKYVMLPLWSSSFRYKEKVYHFLVNGQTGKVAGRYPLSPLRVAIAVILGLAVLALLVWYSMNH